MFRIQATGRTTRPSMLTKVRQAAGVAINGKETRIPEGIRLQLGLKHFVTQALYGKQLAEFQEATNRGDIEKGAEILGKIPKCLTYAFHDLDAIETSKRWG